MAAWQVSALISMVGWIYHPVWIMKEFSCGPLSGESSPSVQWWSSRQLCQRTEWEQRFNQNSLKYYSFRVWIPAPAGGWTNSRAITVELVREKSSEISYEMCRCALGCCGLGGWSAAPVPEDAYRCLPVTGHCDLKWKRNHWVYLVLFPLPGQIQPPVLLYIKYLLESGL